MKSINCYVKCLSSLKTRYTVASMNRITIPLYIMIRMYIFFIPSYVTYIYCSSSFLERQFNFYQRFEQYQSPQKQPLQPHQSKQKEYPIFLFPLSDFSFTFHTPLRLLILEHSSLIVLTLKYILYSVEIIACCCSTEYFSARTVSTLMHSSFMRTITLLFDLCCFLLARKLTENIPFYLLVFHIHSKLKTLRTRTEL